MIRSTYTTLRRVLVVVIGSSVLIVGVIMIVTPGPAIIVIPAGLALLATEFLWARRLLERMKETISKRTGGNNSQASRSSKTTKAEETADVGTKE